MVVLVCFALYFNILFFFPRIFAFFLCFFKKHLFLDKWLLWLDSWKYIQLKSLETYLACLETSTGERNFDYSEKSKISAFISLMQIRRIGIAFIHSWLTLRSIELCFFVDSSNNCYIFSPHSFFLKFIQKYVLDFSLLDETKWTMTYTWSVDINRSVDPSGTLIMISQSSSVDRIADGLHLNTCCFFLFLL
jgi:hypothetical protein